MSFATHSMRPRVGIGVRDGKFFEAVIEFTTAQLATGAFPHIEAMLGHGDPTAAWRRAASTMASPDRFEIGLAIVLDGAAHRWNLAPPPPLPPPPRRRR